MSVKNVVLLYFSNSCCEKVHDILKKENQKITYLKLGSETREELKELTPDVVLVDFHEDFSDVYRNLIELEHPLIFITNPSDEEKVQKFIRTGIHDYIFEDRLKKLPLLIDRIDNKPLSNKDQETSSVERIERFAALEDEKKYYSIFENSLDGILLTEPGGQILAANAAACQIFQMSEEELREVGREGIIATGKSLL